MQDQIEKLAIKFAKYAYFGWLDPLEEKLDDVTYIFCQSGARTATLDALYPDRQSKHVDLALGFNINDLKESIREMYEARKDK